ncbi:phytanoyl-CoA hydroxylase-interacting protein-like [Ditylenchus destructor]|nr:phytanoyl-CoA hydroxylase-interacting protein-like [Ditylenchus destructor]
MREDYYWQGDYPERDTRYGPAPSSSLYAAESWRRGNYGAARGPYDPHRHPHHVPIPPPPRNPLHMRAMHDHPPYHRRPPPPFPAGAAHPPVDNWRTSPTGRLVPRPADIWGGYHHPEVPVYPRLMPRNSPEPVLPIPHAGGDMIAKPIKRKSLENEDETAKRHGSGMIDFSQPIPPKTIKLNFEPSKFKYKQRIEVDDNLVVVDKEELAPHITSYKFKTKPGHKYNVNILIIDQGGKSVAQGKAECRAVFSLDEIDKLMEKAVHIVGTSMHPFRELYRCKPYFYWDQIRLFFSARTLQNGSLPPSSPFGNVRMRIDPGYLLDPARVNMYFCDFYCNRLTHYVTLVICERNSQTDIVERTGDPSNPYIFWVSWGVWVEIYYTENILMKWGAFDNIMATGAGTSKIGGLPHNKSCLTCNLYPIGPKSGNKRDTELVEDLVASYESKLSQSDSDQMFERSSTRYILLGCVQSELLSPSNPVNATISKEDFLQVTEVIVGVVDSVVCDQAAQKLSTFEVSSIGEASLAQVNERDLARPNKDDFKTSQKEEEPEIIILDTPSGSVKGDNDDDDDIILIDEVNESPTKSVEIVETPAESNQKEAVKSSQNKPERLSNPAKIMSMLDKISNTGSQSSNGVSNPAITSPLLRSLVTKVKALVNMMNVDLGGLNSELTNLEKLTNAEP